MEPFVKEPTVDTPKVVLDADKGIFELAQMSLPEDAVDFYAPIIQWFTEYAENPNPKTVFDMKLEYFNTASSKQIIQILLLLQNFKDKSDITVNWYYKEIDEDMQAIGDEYSQIINLPFNLIPVAKKS
ncbi:MAG: DUF1987 domain-containing protein [Bacteroidales bacterium]|jgi:hypothetical protein|nr:DUF1987 domain-containing protein [Bacteroidales bacterium]